MFSDISPHWLMISACLIAGVSPALGALPIYFKKTYSKQSLDFGLGFSAGVMLVAAFTSLLLPGIEEAQKLYITPFSLFIILSGLFIGYFFIIVLHDYLPHEHLFKETDMVHKKKLSRVSLIVFAIALHNIPEGLAVGVGFGTDNLSHGLILALAITLQNIPEGFVVAFGLMSEGISKHKAFLISLATGMVEPVAAFFGYLSTQITSYALPFSLSFAAGAMLFVICQEMFP